MSRRRNPRQLKKFWRNFAREARAMVDECYRCAEIAHALRARDDAMRGDWERVGADMKHAIGMLP